MKKPRIIAAEYLSRFQSGESRDALEKWLDSECAQYDFPDGVRQTIDTYLHALHRNIANEILAEYIERLENGATKQALLDFVDVKCSLYPDPDLIKSLMRPQLRTFLMSRRNADSINDLIDSARLAG